MFFFIAQISARQQQVQRELEVTLGYRFGRKTQIFVDLLVVWLLLII